MDQAENILVLGAGKVTQPLISYLLEKTPYSVTVASRTKAKAENLLKGHQRGIAVELNVDNDDELSRAVENSALVISMLPWIHHLKVAKLCLKHKKNLVTTSYVKPEMRAMDQEVKAAGLIFLNEIGLDPGIDHMSAMKIIDEIRAKGGKVLSFNSLCGGLPAPRANDNPWGYKFSWSPRGVLLAGKNSCQFLKDGQKLDLPSEKLFETVFALQVPELGEFEVYPNRDSLSYLDTYQIPEAATMFRGTIRYPGWCRAWQALKKLNFLDEAVRNTSGKTFRQLMAELIEKSPDDLEIKMAEYLGIEKDDDIIKRFAWLGLFSEEKIPDPEISLLDLLVNLMENKMSYQEGEEDMIILLHEFVAEYPGGKKEKIISGLVSYGKPGGETAMAVTVGTPPAIAAKLIMEGKIASRGVLIPTLAEIYQPVMAELEKAGVHFKEKVENWEESKC